MKAATIQEIKLELSETSPAKLKQLCLHLAKFKKENKELLTYLLFESHDEAASFRSVHRRDTGHVIAHKVHDVRVRTRCIKSTVNVQSGDFGRAHLLRRGRGHGRDGN